jgi:para-aminobenzoate synthetase component 1
MARSLELPYKAATRCEDRYAWFDAIRALGWPVFLDSGDPARSGGRYDILAAAPSAVTTSREGAFAAARALIADESASGDGWPDQRGGDRLSSATSSAVPWRACRPPRPTRPHSCPEAALGLYPWTVVVDHGRSAARRSPSLDPSRWRKPRGAARPAARLDRAAAAAPSPWMHPWPRRWNGMPTCRAHAAFSTTSRRATATRPTSRREFRAPCSGDPWSFYRYLHDTNPAPMGAYLEYPFGTVLSSSPERFLVVDGREVITRPIKGTRRRRADPAEDAAAAAGLAASPKDRAENVMIVDLLRNDLGRVCETGSVKVRGLCEVESFATVHHLVSTVTGTLTAGLDGLDALEACFPGGSITGAPKRRAMQIIDELEPHRREVYCGAIGYVAPGGRLDMNIPIRTTLVAGGELRFYAGGGIVAGLHAAGRVRRDRGQDRRDPPRHRRLPESAHGGERMKDKNGAPRRDDRPP